MEIIYRAKDGKEFTNKEDCLTYENGIDGIDGVRMWNRGARTNETAKAFILYLKDVQANLAFFEMARAQGDDDIVGIVEGEDYGLFVWDEWESTYRYIGSDELLALVVTADALRAEGLL